MKDPLTSKTGNCSITQARGGVLGMELIEGRNQCQQGEEPGGEASGKVSRGLFLEPQGSVPSLHEDDGEETSRHPWGMADDPVI